MLIYRIFHAPCTALQTVGQWVRQTIFLRSGHHVSPAQGIPPRRPKQNNLHKSNLSIQSLKQRLALPRDYQSSRSLHDLIRLEQSRVYACLMVLEKIPGYHSSRDAAFFKEQLAIFDRMLRLDNVPAKKIKKDITQLNQILIGVIAQQIQCRAVPPKKATELAKQAIETALQQFFCSQPWQTIEKQFVHRGELFTSTMVPAGQFKLGERDIFQNTYNNQGVSSDSKNNCDHAINMWSSTLSFKDKHEQQKVLFKGIRHGTLSPYGLPKNSPERRQGARHRAEEVISAALFLQPEKLSRALAGEEVAMRISSTSIVTPTNLSLLHITEADQLDDQMQAWQQCNQAQAITLTLYDQHGQPQKVRIRLEVAAFNFGVNEFALQLGMGRQVSDHFNEIAFHQLLGNLNEQTLPGGWVGDYLAAHPLAENRYRVQTLAQQLKAIWAQKLHHTDGSEPYKAAQRVAMLCYEIGVIPCWNCKSGKDRTAWLDAEIKREAITLHQGAPLSQPGQKLSQEQQTLLQKTSLYAGNSDIQYANTGARGNKALHGRWTWQYFIGLSLSKRLGSKPAWQETQGLSKYIH